jgi:flagellar basal body P-ring formation protein FlgA
MARLLLFNRDQKEKDQFMKRMIPIAPFTIFIATAAFAQVQQYENIAALDSQVATIAKAQPIDPRLKLARCVQPVILEPEQIGAVTLRCVPLGWRIRVPVLQAATSAQSTEMMVRRGETVEMVSDGEGFEISANAIALENGLLGATIRVKSPTGTSVSIATVTARGIVTMSR